MQYELCYLVGESKEQDLPKIKEEVKEIVSGEGGNFLEPQIEEKRKMAYKVKGNVKGTYVTQRFEIAKDEEKSEEEQETNLINNISKKLNLNQNVLRFIIVKAEDLPELKIKEASETVKRDFKRPVYVKKSEPVAAKKPAEVPAVPEVKESKEAVTDEKKAEGKSIDEKIDEILNI